MAKGARERQEASGGHKYDAAVCTALRDAGAIIFAIILVYLVLAAQYESWTIPLSVCFAVPTALLGAVAALMARDMDTNLYTQIGIVLLIGLSAKSAILIVEFARERHAAGVSIRAAALEAAQGQPGGI